MAEFTITEAELSFITNRYLRHVQGVGPGDAMKAALDEAGIETVRKAIQEPSDPDIIAVDEGGNAWERVPAIPTDSWMLVDRETSGNNIKVSWEALTKNSEVTLYRKVR